MNPLRTFETVRLKACGALLVRLMSLACAATIVAFSFFPIAQQAALIVA